MGSFRSGDSGGLSGRRTGQSRRILGRESNVADDLLALEEHSGIYVQQENEILQSTKKVFRGKCRRNQTDSETTRRNRPILASSKIKCSHKCFIKLKNKYIIIMNSRISRLICFTRS